MEETGLTLLTNKHTGTFHPMQSNTLPIKRESELFPPCNPPYSRVFYYSIYRISSSSSSARDQRLRDSSGGHGGNYERSKRKTPGYIMNNPSACRTLDRRPGKVRGDVIRARKLSRKHDVMTCKRKGEKTFGKKRRDTSKH